MAENKNNPNVIQPVMNPGQADKGLLFTLRSNLKWLAIGMGVVVAGVAGVLIWHATHGTRIVTLPKDKNGQPIFQQKFTKITKFTLTGSKAKSGAVFDLPMEFGTRSSATGQVAFNETTSNDAGQEVPLAELAIDSFPLAKPYSAGSLKILNKALSSSSALGAVVNLKDFIKLKMPAGYTPKLESVKQFRSSNVKTNAWAVTASATATDAKDKNLGHQQGEVIYVITDHAYYYFLVMATDYNWANNQSAWQAVFDSLQLDQ